MKYKYCICEIRAHAKYCSANDNLNERKKCNFYS